MALSKMSMNSIYFKHVLPITRNHPARRTISRMPVEVPRSLKTDMNKKKVDKSVTESATEYDISKFMTPTGMSYNLKLTNAESAKVVLEQLGSPKWLLQKMVDTIRTSEARHKVYVQVSERVSRERLSQDYTYVAERLTPLLVTLQSHVFTPLYRTLRTKVIQLHERPLAQEMAQHFGPSVITQLQRLQTRLQQRNKSDTQQAVVASKDQGGVSKESSAMQRLPLLQTVKPSAAPLLSRMISTLTQMIEEKAKPSAVKSESALKATPSDKSPRK